MFDLYKNIKDLCETRGVSVSKMCVDIGVSKSLMSNLKNHRAESLSAKSIEKIANYLGCSTDELFVGQKEKPATTGDELAEYLEDLRERPETRALLEASRGMTKEQVEKMADFARALRGE